MTIIKKSKPDPPERVWPQIFFTIICNLGTMAYGLHLGWLSPLQLKFLTEGSNPLGPDVRAFTRDEVSWIGSIPAIVLMIAPFVYGATLQLVGRKWTLFIATIPNITCLLLLIFSKNLLMLYIARGIGGFAAAIFLLVPVWVNESVEDSIRGYLGTLTGIFINIGIVCAYLFGTYTSYTIFNIIILIFPVIFLIVFFWLPETPYYLISKGKKKEAIKSLQILRGGSLEKNEVVANKIEKMIEESKNSVKVNPWTVVKQKTFGRGIFIILGLLTIQQFVGSIAVTSYSGIIFDTAGTALPANLSSIVMSVLQLSGSIGSCFVIDRLGRRALLIISNSGLSVGLITLTVYLYLKSDEVVIPWLPIVCLCIFVFFYSLGSGSVVYVMLPELFPPQAKPYASAICGCWVSTLSFLILRFFLTVIKAIGLAGVFTIFSATGVCGVLFTIFFVIETKGKSLSETMRKLGGKSQVNDVKNINEKDSYKGIQEP